MFPGHEEVGGALFGLPAIPWIFWPAFLLLISGCVAAYLAVNRGRSAWNWFLVGFCVPVVGPLWIRRASRIPAASLARGLKKIPTTAEPAPCPSCFAPQHPTADHCEACGHGLTPDSSTGDA